MLLDKYSTEELKNIIKNSNSLNQFINNVGYKSNSGDLSKTVLSYLEERGIDENFRKHWKQLNTTNKSKSEDEIFCKGSTVYQSTLRKHFAKLNNIEYKCAICGLPPYWNNMPLTLTLDHIDGDNTNNEKNNLRWVCPNCDRQLPTFGSKRRRKPKNYCIDCGKEIGRKSTWCIKCVPKHRKPRSNGPYIVKGYKSCYKTDWPTNETLLQMVKSSSYEAVGRNLGVTGAAVKKRLKTRGLI